MAGVQQLVCRLYRLSRYFDVLPVRSQSAQVHVWSCATLAVSWFFAGVVRDVRELRCV